MRFELQMKLRYAAMRGSEDRRVKVWLEKVSLPARLMEIWSENICGKLIFFITDTQRDKTNLNFHQFLGAPIREIISAAPPVGSIYRVLLCSGNIFAIPYYVRNCCAFVLSPQND